MNLNFTEIFYTKQLKDFKKFLYQLFLQFPIMKYFCGWHIYVIFGIKISVWLIEKCKRKKIIQVSSGKKYRNIAILMMAIRSDYWWAEGKLFLALHVTPMTQRVLIEKRFVFFLKFNSSDIFPPPSPPSCPRDSGLILCIRVRENNWKQHETSLHVSFMFT